MKTWPLMWKKFFNKILALVIIFLFSPILARAAEPSPYYISPNPFFAPRLSIDIPNLSFTPIIQSGGYLEVWFLADYLSAVYKYMIGISITVAIVIAMFGGVQYVLSSGSGDVGKAKERLKNALVGVILLFSVSLILYTVNPQLSVLKPLKIKFIDPVEMVINSGEKAGAITASASDLNALGIICPESNTDVAAVARSFIGKVTYRFGGKGGAPPYEDDVKTAIDGTPFKDFCPPGTVCLDCSGFIGAVNHCAGLSSVGENGGTAGIFASAPKIESCGKTGVETSSESFELAPGDLVGFQAGDSDKTTGGHVWMYIGNGLLINSAAKREPPGKAVFTQQLQEICDAFPGVRVVHR